jgi:hypothetical protein
MPTESGGFMEIAKMLAKSFGAPAEAERGSVC